jgi:hypothetical protein
MVDPVLTNKSSVRINLGFLYNLPTVDPMFINAINVMGNVWFEDLAAIISFLT